jgi:ATP-binding cassette subfamily F protein 3
MAGLLLGDYNILVLDEPGNHLDVETVESLANALLKYQGTVIFTSHDRHFMKRIASSIVEVRDGTAKNYIGDYDSYLYRVNQEISEGFRNQNQQSVGQSRFEDSQTPKPKGKTARRDQPDRKRQKQIQAIERKIKKLESDKKPLNEEMLQCSDPTKAMELHQQIQAIALEVTELEDRWLELTGEI